MKQLKIFLLVLFTPIIILILLSKFLMADLRTSAIKKNNQSETQISHAKSILRAAVKKQGLDKVNQFSTYKAIGKDHWKGLMGKKGNPWSWNNDTMAMRFTVGDFDGQIEVLEGKHKGFLAGIQSWDYYEKNNNQFDTKIPENKGIAFTLAAFHYFFELGSRLNEAPYIRYIGKENLKNQPMEKIFVSWGDQKTNEYDQYVLWIGEKSGLIEAATFTVRDTPKPTPKFIYSSIRFDDYRNIEGILIPFKQTVHLFEPKNTITDYVHQVTLSDFKWDGFPASKIRPFSNLKTTGNSKLN